MRSACAWGRKKHWPACQGAEKALSAGPNWPARPASWPARCAETPQYTQDAFFSARNLPGGAESQSIVRSYQIGLPRLISLCAAFCAQYTGVIHTVIGSLSIAPHSNQQPVKIRPFLVGDKKNFRCSCAQHLKNPIWGSAATNCVVVNWWHRPGGQRGNSLFCGV